MMGQGGSAGDVFGMRDKFLKERKKLEFARKKAEAPSPMQVCRAVLRWASTVDGCAGRSRPCAQRQ